MKTLKNLMKPLVICGPSGVGKGTLIGMLRSDFPNSFGFSVSHTTRGPRTGEKHGIEYYFIKKEEFESGISSNDFLEFACVHDNFYGTSVKAVEDVFKENKICILDIDVQGVKQVYEHEKYDPYIIFIHPPSMEELERRLRGRKSDSEESIRKRLENAYGEVDFAKTCSDMIDKNITNDNLEGCYEEFKVTIQEVYNIK